MPTVAFGAPRNLVELVEEHDAVLLDRLQRLVLELLLVEHPGSFLVGQELHRLAHLDLAGLAAIARQVLEHALQLARHLLHAGRGEDLDAGGRGLELVLYGMARPGHSCLAKQPHHLL